MVNRNWESYPFIIWCFEYTHLPFCSKLYKVHRAHVIASAQKLAVHNGWHDLSSLVLLAILDPQSAFWRQKLFCFTQIPSIYKIQCLFGRRTMQSGGEQDMTRHAIGMERTPIQPRWRISDILQHLKIFISVGDELRREWMTSCLYCRVMIAITKPTNRIKICTEYSFFKRKCRAVQFISSCPKNASLIVPIALW